MSRQLINEYRSDLARIIRIGGTHNEGTVRDAFQGLLRSWGKSKDLTYLSEHPMTGSGGTIRVDGALVYDIRVPFGYWEAKDSKDDLEAEITAKEAKGYPRTNIIYEDTRRAILIQDRVRVAEADMSDTEQLYALLTQFFAYEQQAIRDFRKAIAKFAEELPDILAALRDIIRAKRDQSKPFAAAELAFLKQVKETINPALERADVTEMLIQHILTEDIFNRVFDMRDYHRDNNIAKQLYALERELFGYGEKAKLLHALRPYYTGIEETAHLIQSHSEKQNFLKSLYENFYKVYNPKAADRLGVVYTPGEIVRFMIRSADWLCEQHFGKNLIDPGVEILDPATGTGTYIVELLEYFRGHPDKLRHKYKEELHANEVAILPYYVANLNIEATFQAITGQFAEFEGLCLVDTLDNVGAIKGVKGASQVADLYSGLSEENVRRVEAQNAKKISVIIGNPPYNANQKSENENNKNRKYPRIDQMIKSTYVRLSNSKKTKRYDMYSCFLMWSSSRIDGEGIISFVCNRNFIDSKEADGFRKSVSRDFSEVCVIDLGGDWKDKGRGGGSNVFGISTGVCVVFLVKSHSDEDFRVHYHRIFESENADDKLSWLENTSYRSIDFELLRPDESGAWVDQLDKHSSETIPLGTDATKNTNIEGQERAVFKLFSPGISTNRDEWMTDRSLDNLQGKAKLFIERFKQPSDVAEYRDDIKWSRTLKSKFRRGQKESYSHELLRRIEYRPFTARKIYFSEVYVDETGLHKSFNTRDRTNAMIGVSIGKRTIFASLASNHSHGLDFFLPNAAQVFPRRRTDGDMEGSIHNITDWALDQFTKHYGKQAGVTKDAIFAYCYAVLHDPVYRGKYALNLKREFPRIPFYPDFVRWVAWGETLLDLHIDYETQEPWPIDRIDTPNPKRAKDSHPKPKLKSQPESGLVVVDEDTQLTGIPQGAWDYRLGNRSAIDWVLDQHKEKKPKDPTIAAKFNTYRFADYKESMIELLAKVVRVSVETNAITDAMKAIDRSSWA